MSEDAYGLEERIAIKLTMASATYHDTPEGKHKARADAIREQAEEDRRAMKSAGYEQRRLL